MFECDKNRSRCTAMLTATLAMAPIYSLRLTARNKTDRAAQAAAFELVGRAAHDLDRPWRRGISRCVAGNLAAFSACAPDHRACSYAGHGAWRLFARLLAACRFREAAV